MYSSDCKFCFLKTIECPDDVLNFILDAFNKLFKLSKNFFSSGEILKSRFFIWIVSFSNFNILGKGIIGSNIVSFSPEYNISGIGFSKSSGLILHSIFWSLFPKTNNPSGPQERL